MVVGKSSALLVLESGSALASAALVTADRRVLSRTAPAGQSHSSELLPMTDALLNEVGLRRTGLAGIVVGVGPGSFTGLRVACGIAQGLSLGLSIPILGVNGFFAWAYAWWSAYGDGRAVSMDVGFDARLGEQFSAQVRIAPTTRGLVIDWGSPPAVRAAMTAALVRSLSPQIDQVLIDPDRDPLVTQDTPFAVWLARWAVDDRLQAQHQWLTASELTPLYVREKVAQTTAERSQNPDLVWVPMTPRDLASVMVIENQAYPFPWSSGNFQDSIAAGYSMWVLREHQVMLGYMVWMSVVDEAHLLNLTLTPARQGHGLGQWMMRSLVAQVRAAGCHRIVLEVRPSNTRALRLYEKSGFKRIGLRKGYYPSSPETAAREDAIVMALEIMDQRDRQSSQVQHV